MQTSSGFFNNSSLFLYFTPETNHNKEIKLSNIEIINKICSKEEAFFLFLFIIFFSK